MYSGIEDVTHSIMGHTGKLKYNLSYNHLSYRSVVVSTTFLISQEGATKQRSCFSFIWGTSILDNYFTHIKAPEMPGR